MDSQQLYMYISQEASFIDRALFNGHFLVYGNIVGLHTSILIQYNHASNVVSLELMCSRICIISDRTHEDTILWWEDPGAKYPVTLLHGMYRNQVTKLAGI